MQADAHTPSGWQPVSADGGQALEKSFAFADFDGAFAFAQRLAALAQAHNHHPSLLLEWGLCRVRWSSHDAGHSVTALDVRCAELTDAVYG